MSFIVHREANTHNITLKIQQKKVKKICFAVIIAFVGLWRMSSWFRAETFRLSKFVFTILWYKSIFRYNQGMLTTCIS